MNLLSVNVIFKYLIFVQNELYYAGLRDAIAILKAKGEGARVLDIGTGTGLLSLMAARLGAESVVACEVGVEN